MMKDIDYYLGLITSQHQVSPKFMAFLEKLLTPFRDTHICAESMIDAFEIDQAVGDQLDIIGEILGLGRTVNFTPSFGLSPTMDDRTYRTALKIKRAKNSWKGQTKQLYCLWNESIPEGSELITNGDFSADTTGWLAMDCSLAVIAGGQAGNCLQITPLAGSYQRAAYQITTLENGKWYNLSVWVRSGTSCDEPFLIQMGTYGVEASVSGVSSQDWKKYSVIFKADNSLSGWQYVSLIKDSYTAGTMLFDIVSVKEISPRGVADNQDMTADIYITDLLDPLVLDLIWRGIIFPRPQGVKMNFYYRGTLLEDLGPFFGYDLNTDTIKGYDEGSWS